MSKLVSTFKKVEGKIASGKIDEEALSHAHEHA
jgi:hypothetical protein